MAHAPCDALRFSRRTGALSGGVVCRPLRLSMTMRARGVILDLDLGVSGALGSIDGGVDVRGGRREASAVEERAVRAAPRERRGDLVPRRAPCALELRRKHQRPLARP